MAEKLSVTLSPEIKGHYDVLVIGGGPSGLAAAISAARCGKNVALLEQSGQLGGMATLGNVAIFMCVGNYMGLYKEIVEKILPENELDNDFSTHCPQFNPLIFRYTVLEMAKQAGVTIYLHTKYVSPVIDGKVTGVIASTRQGLYAFTGKTVIDCTGDGRVAIDSGAQYTTGRSSDGLTQPCTLMLQMQDTGKPVTPYLPEGCYVYNCVSELPQGRTLHWEMNKDGTLLVNMTRVKGNAANAEQVFDIEYESLKQAFSVVYYLQRNGFENYILTSIASQTGVRETNQIKGLYTLSDNDVKTAANFEDVVAQNNYEIDIHNPDGSGTTEEIHIESYDIPYRCMIPEGVEGLLVSGRAISASHVAMSSLRVMPTCIALGQAAGIAAAIACDDNIKLSEVSKEKLHTAMEKQGVVLERKNFTDK